MDARHGLVVSPWSHSGGLQEGPLRLYEGRMINYWRRVHFPSRGREKNSVRAKAYFVNGFKLIGVLA
jgi:hypothetical protein